ncbi:MAG: ATP synthase F1 subunit epsilon [Actinobacteria bacterium]|nr:ATP synthase F1 subunit epsilon [Actinomycetota bacterium]
MALDVQVVSPERILWSGEADLVITRTVDGGDIAFLNGHAPFVGALAIGVTTIRPTGGDDLHVAVHGGFVEVSENSVSILSDVAELAEEIDVERARQAKEQAERTLAHEHDGECEASLRRAHARIQAAGGMRGLADSVH